MKEIKLFEHNEIAYNKLVENLKHTQITTINHATGTGKSFILLKYLYNNKDKKILYLAPTIPIINQLLFEHMNTLDISESDFNQLDTMTYMGLIKKDVEKIANEYDIIVLDEYHRCGATITFKYTKKIIDLIKEKYPDKVVIGTSATEIRYLDNERDMKEILFDGNCASELSLADAIIEGILPAPKYIYIPHKLLEDIKKLRKIIEYNFLWDSEYKNYLKKCDEFERKVQDLMEKYKPIKNELLLNNDDTKKFLVFSSTVDGMKYEDTRRMHQFLTGVHLNEYYVHSKRSRQSNKTDIEEFKESNSGVNLLYSVNLLNEGFHVKDIDAIFMLRQTTSPIIYFQHLGRLLSYSARNKDVYVFDIVNNMSKHKAIVKLYNDLFCKLEDLIKNGNNENNQEYVKRLTYIKNKLALVDFSEELYNEFYKFKEKIYDSRAIRQQILSAINVLNGTSESCIIEKEYAYVYLQKKYEFVDIELFKKIKSLNIYSTGPYSRSVKEFEKLLDGSETLRDYKLSRAIELENEISKYLFNNETIPSLLSNDNEEIKISSYIASNFKYLPADIKNEIRLLVKKDQSLTEFDKANYISNYKIIDKEKFVNDFEYALKNNIYISESLFEQYYNIKDKTKINNVTAFEYTKYFEDLRQECIRNIVKNGEYNTCEAFVKEYISFIDKKLYIPSYNHKDEYELELYSKLIIYKSTLKYYKLDDVISKYISDKNNELVKHDLYIQNIINFCKFNNKLPSINGIDDNEKDMANYYNNYTKGFTNKDIKLLLDKINRYCSNVTFDELIDFVKRNEGILPSEFIEEESNFYKCYKKLNKEEKERLSVVLEEYQDKYIEIAIDYINFIKENKRYPLVVCDDIIEMELSNNYIAVKKLIPKEYKKLIDETLTKCNKHILQINTYNKSEEVSDSISRKRFNQN